MTTFFCLRHGLTDWNRDKRIQGQTDVPLCDEGRDMARDWGRALAGERFDLLLTSPLARAVETGALINEQLPSLLPVETDERLMEQDWGEWTGNDKAAMHALRPTLKKLERDGFGFRPPGGESRDEVLMRACDALLDCAQRHPEARVLVVTHNGVLKCLAYALTGLDFLPRETCPITPYRLHRIESFDNELAPGEMNMELT